MTLRLGDRGQRGGQRQAGARCWAWEGIGGDAWFKRFFPLSAVSGEVARAMDDVIGVFWLLVLGGAFCGLNTVPQRPAREGAPEQERVHLIPTLSVPGAAAFLHSHCPFLLWDHRAPGLSPCAGRVTPACGFRPDLICQCARGKGVGGQMERSAAKGSADCGVRCLKQACPPSVGKARPVAHCPSWPGPRGAAWTGIG